MTDQRTPDARTAEQRVEEIRARLAVATRGPLYLFPVEADEAWPCIKDAHWDVCRQEVDLVDVESSHGVTTGRLEGTMINVGCYLGEKADAELFTNAARDIPWLLSQLDAQAERVRELEQAARAVVDEIGPEYAMTPSIGSIEKLVRAAHTQEGKPDRILGMPVRLDPNMPPGEWRIESGQ